MDSFTKNRCFEKKKQKNLNKTQMQNVNFAIKQFFFCLNTFHAKIVEKCDDLPRLAWCRPCIRSFQCKYVCEKNVFQQKNVIIIKIIYNYTNFALLESQK